MPRSHRWLLLLTIAGLLAGFGIAYWAPAWPLLAYWLVLAMGLGLTLALLPHFGGIQRRLRWVVWTSATLIAMALITTQLAARRAISSTHLVYHGVHIVGVDSLTIGAGPNTTDVRLQAVTGLEPLPHLRSAAVHARGRCDERTLTRRERLGIR